MFRSRRYPGSLPSQYQNMANKHRRGSKEALALSLLVNMFLLITMVYRAYSDTPGTTPEAAQIDQDATRKPQEAEELLEGLHSEAAVRGMLACSNSLGHAPPAVLTQYSAGAASCP
jgi:hypothetical protein